MFAPISNKDKMGQDFIEAAHRGDNNKILELLNQGVKVNVRYYWMPETRAKYPNGTPSITQFSTALHAAVLGGHADTVELLIEKGIRISAKDEKGLTARDLAQGNEEMLKLFLEKRTVSAVERLSKLPEAQRTR